MINFFKTPNLFTHLTYNVDEVLDELLNIKLNRGIKCLIVDYYYIKIVFNDSSEGLFWNANRPNCWLASGYIDSYEWESTRPTRKTMRRFNSEINKFINK